MQCNFHRRMASGLQEKNEAWVEWTSDLPVPESNNMEGKTSSLSLQKCLFQAQEERNIEGETSQKPCVCVYLAPLPLGFLAQACHFHARG